MRQTMRTIHLVIAVLLAIGFVYQVFLAGLGVFDANAGFGTHRMTGYVLGLVPILLIVAGALAGLGRRQILMAGAIFLLVILQSILVIARETSPAIAALHPVNGFLIALISLVIVRDAWASRNGAAAAAAG